MSQNELMKNIRALDVNYVLCKKESHNLFALYPSFWLLIRNEDEVQTHYH